METVSPELRIRGNIKFDRFDNPAASGGFAKVYVGHHPVHGRVALKHVTLATSLEDERSASTQRQTLKLVRAEVEAWKSLNHPHVLRFLGLYNKKDRLFMVSPWAEGGVLTEYLVRNPGANRARFIYQVSDALKYLHEQNVIHGDVKGSNILLSRPTHALLFDFGMSRVADDNTQTQLKGGGSHRWMAPEILDNKRKSFASDVFSFGITIYELLSGRMPLYDIQDSLIAALALTRGMRPPKTPRSSAGGEPYEDIWEIAESCWQEQPSGRPSMVQVSNNLSKLSISSTSSTTPQGSEASTDMIGLSQYASKGKISIDKTYPVGAGSSYKGRHSQYGHVVLRRMSRNVTAEGVMLRAEITAWKSLSHPHILQIYGLYESDEVVYIVTPWVENGSLPSYLLQYPNADRARFLRETANALCYLFSRNIIHGNIKGSNILVSATTHALLCDVGMSILTNRCGGSAGAPIHMAPELWNHEVESFASDIFAFGMTIAEILSGNMPFHHLKTHSAVSAAISAGQRPSREPRESPDGAT
ncbi:hypothetical protein FRB99_008171, partial [Tulasnella sp. 403]